MTLYTKEQVKDLLVRAMTLLRDQDPVMSFEEIAEFFLNELNKNNEQTPLGDNK